MTEIRPPALEKPLDRSFALEAVRVTEAAAIAAFAQIGRGNEHDADRAAVEAMRAAFNVLPIDGTVVIGEGERDEAPMLFIGEKVGQGGLAVDIALDPLEGTTLTAKAMANALAVMAMAEPGTMLKAPDTYMDKIAIGPGYKNGIIDLDAEPGDNINAVARAKGVSPDHITTLVMDRPRHEKLIAKIRAGGRQGEADHRRRCGRRDRNHRSRNRRGHLYRHRRRSRRCAGRGGAALCRRPNAGPAGIPQR